MRTHDTWVKRHDSVTGRGRYKTHCSCGFVQGAVCHEEADAVARGHHQSPSAQAIIWYPGPPRTADTITDQDLRDLFARHCECRPLDLERGERDHAAIHDCDTGILADVQIAIGINLLNDIGRVQAIREARGRYAEVINAARKDR